MLTFAVSPVFATTFTVTSTNDSGTGTLRAAMQSAQSGDSINFNVATPATITLMTSLTFSSSVSITGPGASLLTISGNNAVRVVSNPGFTVSISDLTISNGNSTSSTVSPGQGGGILTYGSLTLTNVTLSSNAAEEGGAINNSGTVMITNCTITGNSVAAGTFGAGGGGIWNFGTMTITGSTITNNTSTGKSGSSNSSGLGAGILNEFFSASIPGMLTISNSTISGNTATGGFGGQGAGIDNFPSSTLSITNSTISGNMATGSTAQSGGIENEGTATITGSTISGNSATNAGGGIFNNTATLTMLNSTVANNTAGNNGGGIMNTGPAMKLSFVTFYGNQANSDGFGIGHGDGIANFATGAQLKAVILANETSTGNCYFSTAITSDGYNLADDTSCTSGFSQSTDLPDTPAMLGSLQNNGGSTLTLEPQATSLAIDAIPVGNCTDVNGTAVTVDQIGTTRPQGPKCDIGAVEVIPSLQSQSITFNSLSNQVYGTAPFTVSATASSTLPVSFASLTTSFCSTTGTNGSTVTLLMVGQCTIQATQAGNSSFSAANPVSQSFQITQANQTINFAPLPNVPLSAGTITVSATATSGQPVSFGSLTSGTCSVSGSTVTLSAGGTCTIQAMQNGNTNYAAATPVNQSFLITTVPQIVVTHSLSRSDGVISVVVTLTNTGTGTANNVEITVAKIGSTVTTTSLPQPSVGSLTLPNGGGYSVTLTFPGTIGSTGANTTLTIDGTYTGGSFGGTSRITLP